MSGWTNEQKFMKWYSTEVKCAALRLLKEVKEGGIKLRVQKNICKNVHNGISYNSSNQK